jgi:hypothetical protein
MSNKTKMIADTRLFLRLAMFSFLGMGFYYSHLFLGLCGNAFIFKALAVTFLAAAIPLPIIAYGNKKLFPELGDGGKVFLNLAALLLLMHHFLMTFIFVMFLQDGRVY